MESTTPQPQNAGTEGKKPQRGTSGCLVACVVAFGFVVVFGCCLGPIGSGGHGHQSAYVQASHAIGLAMYSYANDHNQLYPDGTSSTEVFQQLLDGGYVTDPSIFYAPMDGKTPLTDTHKKLKPENVCWDVTGGVSGADAGQLPLVFLTGYRFAYAPGGGFTPLTPFPRYQHLTRDSGEATFFVNNSCAWMVGPSQGSIYSLEHVLPADFNAHGKTYRQLTPEGVLK